MYYLILRWLFFAAGLLLITGLFAPKLVIRWGRIRSRGCVILNYGFVLSLCGMLMSLGGAPVKTIDPNSPALIELPAFQKLPRNSPQKDHYELILRYAEGDKDERAECKKLLKEWREKGKVLHLPGADFKERQLAWISFEGAQLASAEFQNASLLFSNFKDATVQRGNFRGAKLWSANFEQANLSLANFREAELNLANFEGANLESANLEGANLQGVNLKGANLMGAHLEGALLTWKTDLRGANLTGAHLEGTQIWNPIVDSSTSFYGCKIDGDTYFRSVPLGSTRIDCGTLQLVEYNMRRKNWEQWYEDHKIIQWPVRLFWWTSDYGVSTARLFGVFFGAVLLFANIYCNWGLGRDPGIVSHLFENMEDEQIPKDVVPWRALYFSLVTMTTLGLGDIRARADRKTGHILLSIQVLLGYFLLGALITRLAILFTAGGPAGSFS